MHSISAKLSSEEADLMAALIQTTPVLQECLEHYGDWSLRDYLSYIAEKSRRPAMAAPLPKSDVAQAAQAYLTPVCGAEYARKTAQKLLRQRLLLTANHQQAEFCAHVVQGNLLYAALLELTGEKDEILPVASCATVNLSNRHFPRGIMMYHTTADLLKIPVFFNRYREDVMCAAIGFNEEMVRHGQKILKRHLQDGVIGEPIFHEAWRILEEDFLAPDVLARPRYAEQSILLNQRMLQRAMGGDASTFCYMELEELSIPLLVDELRQGDSFNVAVLFNPACRERLAVYLNGNRGCWNSDTRQGTFMFWGIDEKRRRYSLWLSEDGAELWGTDMNGQLHRHPFEPGAICERLRSRQLIPGLFLSFLQLYFLRDYQVCGGYFQGHYLSQMQQALCRTLQETGLFPDHAAYIRSKESHYLSGPIILTGQNGKSYPYATLEMLEQGGIPFERVKETLSMTMLQAHVNGLHGIRTDIAKPSAAGGPA